MYDERTLPQYVEPSLLDLEEVAGGNEGAGCRTSGSGSVCAKDGCFTGGSALIEELI